ncbi:MAG: MerR family transcriptional regulator [Acidobacteriota bacterium]
MIARAGSHRSGEARGHALWAMTAVSRATGIGQHTLRAWERRFGFPDPERLPSGHRRYTADQVARLRLISRALAAGHRAGDVVPLPLGRLETLLAAESAPAHGWTETVLERARAFDRDAVVALLEQAYASGGAREFLRERLVPLAEATGEAWRNGRLEIRHEHFLSEILVEMLHRLRASLEAGAGGRPVLLATLPEEEHTLGLHMAALTAALAGRPVRLLGANTPVDQIAAAAREMEPAAVGLSVSVAAPPVPAADAVRRLSRSLPPGVPLWVGGAGAAHLRDLPAPAEPIPGLDGLERALARLA